MQPVRSYPPPSVPDLCAGTSLAPTATDSAAWAPLPFPTRKSPHYTLRSVAFSKEANAILLPRIEGGASEAQPKSVLTLSQTQDIAPESQLKARLEGKRDAALAEYNKVQAQLYETREKLEREKRGKIRAKQQTNQLREQTKLLNQKRDTEAQKVIEQQMELKVLRSKLKELKPQGRHVKAGQHSGSTPLVAPGDLSTMMPAAVDSNMAPVDEELSSDDDEDRMLAAQLQDIAAASQAPPQWPMPVVPEAVVEIAPPTPKTLDEGLEGLLSEMQRVRKAVVALEVGASDSWRPDGCDPALNRVSDDDEEAEIELLRNPGAPAVIRLRHPRGAEAIVDAHEGLVLAWRLADGRTSGPSAVKAMRLEEAITAPNILPKASQADIIKSLAEASASGSLSSDMVKSNSEVVKTGDAAAASAKTVWQLTPDGLDDSNNEPSATLVCDCSVLGLRLTRKFLLGADWLREDLVAENVSASECNFSLTTEEAVLPSSGPARAVLRSGGASPILQHSSAVVASSTISLPAWGRWTSAQWWVAKPQGAS